MKRTLITADLHQSDEPVNSYRLDFVDKELLRLLEQERIERVIIAGDLTEKKDRHSAWLTHHIVKSLHQLARVAELFIVEGNHDFQDIDYPFFRFVERLDSEHAIHWISRPRLLDEGLLLLPHTSDYKRDWVKLPRCQMIITHNTFHGAMSERGGKLRGIPLTALPRNVQVFSGDVHEPQQLGMVCYIGPPYTIYFGDTFAPRVLLMDERSAVHSKPTKAPRKLLLELDYPWQEKQFDQTRRGDIVKLRITITQKEAPQWHEIRDAARSLTASRGCQVFAVQPILLRSSSRRGQSASRTITRKNDSELIRDYCSRLKLDRETMAMGLQLATPAAATANAQSVTVAASTKS